MTVDPNRVNDTGAADDNQLRPGDIIKLADDYVGGGQAGAFYRYQPQSGVTQSRSGSM